MFEIAILLRVVPPASLVRSGELDEHRKERLVRAFDYLKGPANHKVAATELLHYGRDARFIFFHLCGILDFANID